MAAENAGQASTTMYTNPQKLGAEHTKRLRKEAGDWLKGLRTRRAMTQREVSDAIGLRYYTQYAQIEAGVGRLPVEHYPAVAGTLGVGARTLARRLMRSYDPVTHDILFGEAGEAPESGASIVRPAPQIDKAGAKALRQEAGVWLKGRREARGLSQRQLADAMGYPYYTRVSQIERGVGRVPPEEYAGYAEALALDVGEVAGTLFGFYDPIVHHYAMVDDLRVGAVR